MINLLRLIPCHRRPDRSFFIQNKQMPVCARCFGILYGYLPLPFFFYISIPWYLGVALLLPLLLDGYTQKWKWRESTNILRVTTGICFGVGQCIMIKSGVMLIVNFLS
ncbi:DUF2085 domain-containing protein [Paenibacillus taichungensis]